MNSFNIVIIGSGLSGSVLANLCAHLPLGTSFSNPSSLSGQQTKILVIEKRDHLGGNCYDFYNEFGILEPKYGAHIFHTNNERVWSYIQRYSEWIPYHHKVYSRIDHQQVPFPINITTINMLFNTQLRTPTDMEEWLAQHRVPLTSIQNGKDAVLSKCGVELYDRLFKHYTKKQWNKYPEELDPSVLNRIQIRTDFTEGYFRDVHQAMPSKGYTFFIQNLLNHPSIEVSLETEYDPMIHRKEPHQILIFTGAIDHYFRSFQLPPLEYRSLEFEREVHPSISYYQSNSVINYPEPIYKFTRIVEPKHFYPYPSNHQGTVILKEYSTHLGEPYYPVLNERNLALYKQYQEKAEQLEKEHIYFVGRLANYKYFNMDEAIANAMALFDRLCEIYHWKV